MTPWGQSVASAAAVKTAYACTRANFNINAVNLVSGTGATAAPTFLYGARRMHDTSTNWLNLETSNDVFVWTGLDALFNALPSGAYGWMDFGFPAPWASSNPGVAGIYGVGSCEMPAVTAQYVDYVTQVINRWGSRMQYAEGWNEANLSLYWHGTVAQAASLQNTLYSTVKALNSNILVISPAPTSVDRFSMPGNSAWLESLIAAGCTGFDVFGLHAYCDTAASFYRQMQTIYQFFADGAYLRARYGKPCFITEIGQQAWDTTLNDTQREQYLKRSMMLSASFGIPMAWYAYDSATCGDITSAGRQAWWTDMYTRLVGHTCEFVSFNNDASVTIKIDGSTYSF